MPTYIGNQKLKSCYIGNNKVKKIYVGNSIAYSSDSAGEEEYIIIPAQTLITFNSIIDVQGFYNVTKTLSEYPEYRGFSFIGDFQFVQQGDNYTIMSKDGTSLQAVIGEEIVDMYSNDTCQTYLNQTFGTLYISEDLEVPQKLYDWIYANATMEVVDVFTIPAGTVITFNDVIDYENMPFDNIISSVYTFYVLYMQFESNGTEFIKIQRQGTSPAIYYAKEEGTTGTLAYANTNKWVPEYQTITITEDYASVLSGIRQWFYDNTDYRG